MYAGRAMAAGTARCADSAAGRSAPVHSYDASDAAYVAGSMRSVAAAAATHCALQREDEAEARIAGLCAIGYSQ